MCSIAGFFNPNIIPDQEKSRRILTAMNKCQCHRGPDEEDIIQAGGCGMAHTRLSIRDISRGHQPMKINKNGNNYYIVYNGEIYNHKELKNKLTSRGYSFNTTCDTEVLLNTFICFGPDYFENVNGIFSCAIYDESEKTVYLFKDHFGVKPLFYTISKGTLIWGSEIKALFCHPEISPEIDDESLRELTGLGPAKLNYSGVFKNIHAVKPGHYIKYSKKGFLEAPFFTLKTRYHSDTYNETVEHTGYLVKDAILKQIVSDVPICTFLSGGLDSSIVSAVCADKLKENGQQLSTFSFEFAENDKYFKSNSFQPTLDKDYAALMAVDLDTDHRILTITYEETLNALYESVLSRDLPTMADVDSSLLLFCRQVSKTHKVVLTGECADEVFGGYPWFYRPELLNVDTFPWMTDMYSRTALLKDTLIEKLDIDTYVKDTYNTIVNKVAVLPDESAEAKSRRRIGYINLYMFMATLLERMDRTSMWSGLEARVPFADHRLIEYIYNVPWEFKYRDDTEKHLLRTACRDILPESIFKRKKSPYPKTYNPFYEKALNAIFTDIINTPSEPVNKLIDKEKAMRFMNSTMDYGRPWYGQLMAGPQLIAYYIQINYWLKKYDVNII